MNMNKNKIAKWVQELRSGKYKQTKHQLNNQYGYCCLGVACKTFLKPKDIAYTEYLGNPNAFIYGSTFTSQPKAPKWLKDIEQDFLEKTGTFLSYLNDKGYDKTKSLTFDEIADLLEAVYIHEVLK